MYHVLFDVVKISEQNVWSLKQKLKIRHLIRDFLLEGLKFEEKWDLKFD